MDVRADGLSTAAPQVVWSLLSAIEAWPRWTPTVTSVTRSRTEEDGPKASGSIGVGSRFSVTQPRLGRANWVVTEWEEGRSFTWVSRRPGVRTTASHQVHPQDADTRMELTITWDGPGAWLVRALFRRMTQRYTDIELSSLVAAAEAEPSACALAEGQLDRSTPESPRPAWTAQPAGPTRRGWCQAPGMSSSANTAYTPTHSEHVSTRAVRLLPPADRLNERRARRTTMENR